LLLPEPLCRPPPLLLVLSLLPPVRPWLLRRLPLRPESELISLWFTSS
jgi:hypothetical protein